VDRPGRDRRKPPSVSVIIPALNEEESVAAAILSARSAGADEVIVVDGGSADGTVAAARPLADRVILASAGRARQMNAGARASRGDVLVFLHADTTLPAGSANRVRGAMTRDGVVGGAFCVGLAVSPGASALHRAVLALTGRMINVRARLFRAYTGDQAIFVRRDAFDRIGAFPEIPLMEDVELSRRMTRHGKTVLLPVRLATSARRWETRGIFATILLMWFLRIAYLLGMTPQRCARRYRGSAPDR
jgi:rSAM/selenodomain-associated transferase 2